MYFFLSVQPRGLRLVYFFLSLGQVHMNDCVNSIRKTRTNFFLSTGRQPSDEEREIWRDLARSGEIWRDIGHRPHVPDMARYGEIWRDGET